MLADFLSNFIQHPTQKVRVSVRPILWRKNDPVGIDFGSVYFWIPSSIAELQQLSCRLT
jgi:hypothetical protein